MKPLLLLLIPLLLCSCRSESVSVTPTPHMVKAGKGVLKSGDGWEKDVVFTQDSTLSPEAYRIEVGRKGIKVDYGDRRSRLHAMTTLRQIRRPDGSFPHCRIEDSPRFPFRVFMLDPCRHFISVEQTRKFLLCMAQYKLNYFHWHLTEDQGWRLEIDSYPRLTEVGAWREKTMVGHFDDSMTEFRYDDTPHGGFYSKEDVARIVAYADSLGIEIIPEIDMPGHIQSALAAYPFLGCTGGPYKVMERWGISKEVLCPGKESTFDFLEAVLKEVAEMFPGKYIHIGGDEVPLERWKACPDCQRRMRELGLKDEAALMSWFIDRVCGVVRDCGKTPMLYEEAVMKGGSFPADDVVIMDAVQGPSKGYASIMSDYEFSYFDYCQGPHKTEPLSIGGYIPPRKLYRYDPYRGIAEADRDKVQGAVCYLWTEYITDSAYAEYMTFPRMQVFSELTWSSHAGEDWEKFSRKLVSHDYPIMDAMGVNYSRYAETQPRPHLPLIPYPQSVVMGQGSSSARPCDAVFRCDSALASAAYRIKVSSDSLLVTYGGEKGLRYANATLAQLEGANLPVCEIEDYPARQDRTLLLDCTRKCAIEEIYLILSEMARFKYSRFLIRPHSFYSDSEFDLIRRHAESLGLDFEIDSSEKSYEYPFAVPFSMAQGAHERKDPYAVYLSSMYTYSISAEDMTAYVSLEEMPDEGSLEYMLFPRLAVFAENLWEEPSQRDFGRAMEVIWDREFKRWTSLGINARYY